MSSCVNEPKIGLISAKAFRLSAGWQTELEESKVELVIVSNFVLLSCSSLRSIRNLWNKFGCYFGEKWNLQGLRN